MDNSYIIFSNTIMHKVREICINNNLWYRDSDMGVSVMQIDSGMRIWWLSLHHKINQNGIVKQQAKHITKNEFGDAKTRWRSRQSEGLLRNAPNN